MSASPEAIAAEIGAAFHVAGAFVPTETPASPTEPSDIPRLELEAKGWRVWYAEMFGQRFVDALDSTETDDKHHSDAIEWHWKTRRALIHIELEERKLRQAVEIGLLSQENCNAQLAALYEQYFPTFLAYFTIWSRGHLKTTIVRRVIVADACLSASAGVGGYALILGGTKKKIARTASSIEALLHSPKVREYYPLLSQVKRSEKGTSKGWRADFLNTEANYVFDFVGLDEGMAGANEEDVRPTFIVPDDLDQRSDSEVIAEKNFYTFTHEILPMGQWNTLVWWAQNLISRFSCMYRIWKQHARVLTNRVFTNPIPAVRNLVTKVETVNNIVKDLYVSGQPTSRLWDARRIQQEIDREGLPAFLKECQHEVDKDKKGLILKPYNDAVHVISKSEFHAMYGTRDIPRRWSKHVFNDWSRTKTKYHANVAGIVTISSQNSPLPGSVFLFHPMSFEGGKAVEDVAVRILSTISPTVRVDGTEWKWKDLVKSTLQKTGLSSLIGDTTKLISAQRSVLAKVIPQRVRPILRAQNYGLFRGSHEQNKTGALEVYQTVFGMPFVPANPTGDGGIDNIALLMRVDYDSAHPFRPEEKGFTKFFVIADDDTTQGPKVINKVKVYPPVPYNDALTPDDLHDADLFRYQAQNCRYREPYLTVAGEKEGELLKLNDDFIQGLMMLFYDGIPEAAPLSEAERVVEATPESSRYESLLEESPHDKGLLPHQELEYIIAKDEAKRSLGLVGVETDMYGNLMEG